jgi:hypothetical protein
MNRQSNFDRQIAELAWLLAGIICGLISGILVWWLSRQLWIGATVFCLAVLLSGLVGDLLNKQAPKP